MHRKARVKAGDKALIIGASGGIRGHFGRAAHVPTAGRQLHGFQSGRVLLTPHVPAHLVNPLADIAITHGGAGTVQTAIHSGTPLVGIPMHLEQTGNLSLVTRQRAGLMLSK